MINPVKRSQPLAVTHPTLYPLPYPPGKLIGHLQYAYYKRCFDLLTSGVALFLFAPIMCVIALLVKWTSPGPVFYTQDRVTQYDRVFRIYKFRTMTHQAERQTGPTWVQPQDPRVTPLGRLLRNTHLDELPQLINILRGDMSMVGPRPERPMFVTQFKADKIPHYAYRHLVKSGLTGYAQLQNPNPAMEGIFQKTQDDLWYIEHWSLLLDWVLCWQTAIYFFHSCLHVTRQRMSYYALHVVPSSETRPV
jgi:lipopolysaccharide/colanic/teichoic acid biosynthesis glycosyltransferase